MKELTLTALIDRADATPEAVCRWLFLLCSAPADPAEEKDGRLFYFPTPDTLEVWLPEEPTATSGDEVLYRRLSFRPRPVAPAAAGKRLRCPVEVTLPPPRRIYLKRSLSELDMLGAPVTLAAVGNEVTDIHTLTHDQLTRMDNAHAVLMPKTIAGLRSQGEDPGRMPLPEASLTPLRDKLPRLLARCFRRTEDVEGYTWSLSLDPADVTGERIVQVDEAHRRLKFGASGTDLLPRDGLLKHGACLPVTNRQLDVTIFYPEGHREAVPRLFRLLQPMAPLTGMRLVSNPDNWIAYDVNWKAAGQVTAAFNERLPLPAPDICRLHCLLMPSGSEALPLKEQSLACRFRCLAHIDRAACLAPIPLHAVTPQVIDRLLPTLAARLLLQLDGIPWMPQHFASSATDLVAGISSMQPDAYTSPYQAAAFYTDSPFGYRQPVCVPAGNFVPLFRQLLRAVCERFYEVNDGSIPRRVVIYCHDSLPDELLPHLGSCVKGLPQGINVVLARVGCVPLSRLRYYDPDLPGCLPPAGTCLCCDEGSYLLFCRNYVPATEGRRAQSPVPLRLTPNRLSPAGELLPLHPQEVKGLLVQACQLVWANPWQAEGAPLPLVLTQTDRLVRFHCQAHRQDLRVC